MILIRHLGGWKLGPIVACILLMQLSPSVSAAIIDPNDYLASKRAALLSMLLRGQSSAVPVRPIASASQANQDSVTSNSVRASILNFSLDRFEHSYIMMPTGVVAPTASPTSSAIGKFVQSTPVYQNQQLYNSPAAPAGQPIGKFATSAISKMKPISPSDIAVIPVPGALWLFCSGLFALFGIFRRSKASNH